MFRFFSMILVFSLAMTLVLTNPGFSRGKDDGGGFSGGGGGGAGLSSAVTKAVVKSLSSGIGRCQTLKRVYRFDCYRQTYHLTANLLNGRPAYSGARKALVAVEETLKQILERHKDPNVASIRKGFQTFIPVKPAAVPKVTAQLERALDQAETVLLRAPERSGKHYARIAEAVHSSKVLLRSRLFPGMQNLFRMMFA